MVLTRRAARRLTVRQSGSSQSVSSSLASTLTWWTMTRTWTTSAAKALSPQLGDVPQDRGSVQVTHQLHVIEVKLDVFVKSQAQIKAG